MNEKSIVVGFLTVVVVIAGIFFFSRRGDGLSFFRNTTKTEKAKGLADEVKTQFFSNSSPAHEDVFADIPVSVVVNFATVLSQSSGMVIEKDGVVVTSEDALLEENGRTLRQTISKDSGDGTYTVTYTMCSSQESCEDGSFEFVVDSEKQSNYTDERGKKSVNISMNNSQFNEDKIIIDQGTVVVWQNDEDAVHFVTSDPVEEANVFSEQNSREIKQDEVFSVIFEKPGEYAYHCMAHVDSGMIGRIIVE